MADLYKIAVASSDGQNVDTHFGHASYFIIYEADGDTGEFLEKESRDVTAACSGGECSPSGVAELLKDVEYVLVARIGPHAIQALARNGITAYDIVMPVDEAIRKINDFRTKIKLRQRKEQSDYGKNS